MHSSSTGSPPARSGTAPEAVHPLEAHALELAERARRRAPQQPSTGTPQTPPVAGDGRVARTLRLGGVPADYAAGEWSGIRDDEGAIREWARLLPSRLLPRRDRNNPHIEARPNWALAGHGLLIAGPVGTGKSTAAALCCRRAAQLFIEPVWYHVGTLLDQLGGKASDRREVSRRASSCDLLVLDDFGARELADWEVGHLDTIVEARYNSRRPMIVTTNWTPADLHADERLARLTDRWRDRTASRLVVLAGASRRG